MTLSQKSPNINLERLRSIAITKRVHSRDLGLLRCCGLNSPRYTLLIALDRPDTILLARCYPIQILTMCFQLTILFNQMSADLCRDKYHFFLSSESKVDVVFIASLWSALLLSIPTVSECFILAEFTDKMRLRQLGCLNCINFILTAGICSEPGCFPKLGCVAKAMQARKSRESSS